MLFGPDEEDDRFWVLDKAIFPDVLAIAGVFPSKKSARSCGWGTKATATFKRLPRLDMDIVDSPGLEIPEGFTDFLAGKGKLTRITILKETAPRPDEDPGIDAICAVYEKYCLNG